MRVVHLKINDFMRIKAVRISPDGKPVVVIRGANAQGKTSILQALAAAMQGKKAVPQEPIRTGQKKSEIVVDLDEYVVERTFTKSDSYLKVTAKDGSPIKSPQQLLDKLVGDISFDPLLFTRMPAKEQSKILSKAVGLDFSDIDSERKRLYDERRDVNRMFNEYDAALKRFASDLPGTCHERIDISGIMQAYRDAQEEESKRQLILSNVERLDQQSRFDVERINALKEEIAIATQEIATISSRVELRDFEIDGLRKSAEQIKAPDIDELSTKIRLAQEANRVADKFDQYETRKKQLVDLAGRAGQLTDDMESLDADKQAILESTSIPVPGLSFTENGIFLNGIPFSQLSSSEQLKVSTLVAMVINPTLRVIRITDGSLLDKNSMSMMQSLAEQYDFQVWIEVVDESKEGVGILIEDGEVAHEG